MGTGPGCAPYGTETTGQLQLRIDELRLERATVQRTAARRLRWVRAVELCPRLPSNAALELKRLARDRGPGTWSR